MDSLPVELLQLVLGYCDSESIRNLRLLTPTLADIGYDYLLPPDFFALPWRDDVARLRAIATHERLRFSIKSVTFNFTEVDIENARQATYYETMHYRPDHQTNVLTKAWRQCAEFEQRRLAITPLHALDPADLAATFRSLANLHTLAVTFRHTPYDIDELRMAMLNPASAKMNYGAAIKRLNVLMAALQQACASRPSSGSSFGHSARSSRSSRGDLFSFPSSASAYASAPTSAVASAAASIASTRTSSPVSSAVSSPAPSSPASPPAAADEPASRCRLDSFSIDRLPFELFRHQADRRLWFQCRDVFAGLTRLELALDTSNVGFPLAKVKAVNGLGYVLRMAPNLTHLSLAFHNHSIVRELFMLSLRELLGETGSLEGPPLVSNSHGFAAPSSSSSASDTGFRFRALTDLKLEGVVCDESDLRGFLLRHAATLERLRLGGRGMAGGGFDLPMGGVRLSNGTFWSLFRSLRGGRLPHLQRMHLEGAFFCETGTLVDGPGVASHNHVDAGDAGNATGDAVGNAGSDAGDTAADAVPPPLPPPPAHPTHPNLARTRYEHYLFRAITDDAWEPATPERAGPVTARSMTSESFEAYVLGRQNEYPGRFQG
ncbi:uncharacterized protein SPSK_01600 [Sporothrix schenckii 1099-18]|uniref:F-box domain-containing protein n=1 Tax=Sporothrix schenckii 1099-18 TaxID=1397361 RepID=A0A0F2ME87_SPOSC|nr:uncharacterized protein SPSK_01600 [Sporothrix schenckii 1099-18]KJR87170.1 hypothetical protein SPSK_01600 [Sporothrix schenckii 1099-18]